VQAAGGFVERVSCCDEFIEELRSAVVLEDAVALLHDAEHLLGVVAHVDVEAGNGWLSGARGADEFEVAADLRIEDVAVFAEQRWGGAGVDIGGGLNDRPVECGSAIQFGRCDRRGILRYESDLVRVAVLPG